MMPEEKRQLLLTVFSKLKQKIIWKVVTALTMIILKWLQHLVSVGGGYA